MSRLRAFFIVFVCTMLLWVPVLAEDCFTINLDTLDLSRVNDDAYIQTNLTAQTQGIRVLKTISDSNELAARVRLTISQAETNTVIFDKNYGYVGGTFDSGDIYLPYVDNNLIPYSITLSVEDQTYTVPFMHLQPRLTNNSGCTYGIRLRDLSLTDGWTMGTMLDLNALTQCGGETIPLCASNLYIVGQATVRASGDQLTVNLSFDSGADVEVLSSAVYLIGDVSALTSVASGRIGQPAYGEGQAISIAGMDSALLYVPFTLNYNATGLSEFSYNSAGGDIAAQMALWNANLQSH